MYVFSLTDLKVLLDILGGKKKSGVNNPQYF